MKKLLFLLFFLPSVSFGQTYNEIMSINSLDTYKKVVIENGYEYANLDEDEWVTYGFDVARDSTNKMISAKIFTSYNTKDHRWSFQIPMTFEVFFVKEETENASKYYSITKEIKANCKYYKILNYKEADYVSYSCSESSYKGKIGFVISEGYGIIRHFPED